MVGALGLVDFLGELAEIGFLGPFGAVYATAEAFGGVAGTLLGFGLKGHGIRV